jgi:hypothetical protein
LERSGKGEKIDYYSCPLGRVAYCPEAVAATKTKSLFAPQKELFIFCVLYSRFFASFLLPCKRTFIS